MMEHPINVVEQSNASKRSQRALRVAAAREPIVFWPADNFDDRLLRVLVVGDDRANRMLKRSFRKPYRF